MILFVPFCPYHFVRTILPYNLFKSLTVNLTLYVIYREFYLFPPPLGACRPFESAARGESNPPPPLDTPLTESEVCDRGGVTFAKSSVCIRYGEPLISKDCNYTIIIY